MDQQTDVSYGVIALYKHNGEYRVLLVEQISHRDTTETFWTFPKGHAENDESPQQAAVRELAEETGVTDIVLDEKTSFTMSYTFTHAGVQIQKTVIFFLGYTNSMNTNLTLPEEIANVGWFPLSQATGKLAHDNARRLLEEVVEYIRSI